MTNIVLCNENGNTQNDKHIAIDVEDLIIIDTGDALLVSKKGSSQKVQKL